MMTMIDPSVLPPVPSRNAKRLFCLVFALIRAVTGSMGGVPRKLQTKLPELFGLLLRKDYCTDPQLLFVKFVSSTST